jgi:hypothetical protein
LLTVKEPNGCHERCDAPVGSRVEKRAIGQGRAPVALPQNGVDGAGEHTSGPRWGDIIVATGKRRARACAVAPQRIL